MQEATKIEKEIRGSGEPSGRQSAKVFSPEAFSLVGKAMLKSAISPTAKSVAQDQGAFLGTTESKKGFVVSHFA